ncbi:MAG: hypothetical protein GXP63_01425 [DPANN group archaeon]|nr:hypothetical protein [DPANN group archaeon]
MVIGKVFAIVMLPLSILIILEELGIFTLSLPVDKVFLGAILMVGLQLMTLILLKVHHGRFSIMSILTALIFTLVAIGAATASLHGYYKEQAPLILGVMMFGEAIYALH